MFPFVHFRRLAHATWVSVLGVVTILCVNAVIVYRCVCVCVMVWGVRVCYVMVCVMVLECVCVCVCVMVCDGV